MKNKLNKVNTINKESLMVKNINNDLTKLVNMIKKNPNIGVDLDIIKDIQDSLIKYHGSIINGEYTQYLKKTDNKNVFKTKLLVEKTILVPKMFEINSGASIEKIIKNIPFGTKFEILLGKEEGIQISVDGKGENFGVSFYKDLPESMDYIDESSILDILAIQEKLGYDVFPESYESGHLEIIPMTKRLTKEFGEIIYEYIKKNLN